jgi:hypothetical protein
VEQFAIISILNFSDFENELKLENEVKTKENNI